VFEDIGILYDCLPCLSHIKTKNDDFNMNSLLENPSFLYRYIFVYYCIIQSNDIIQDTNLV